MGAKGQKHARGKAVGADGQKPSREDAISGRAGSGDTGHKRGGTRKGASGGPPPGVGG